MVVSCLAVGFREGNNFCLEVDLVKSAIRGFYMYQGLNSHYFHIIGDGHQPNSTGVRWDDHPQYSDF